MHIPKHNPIVRRLVSGAGANLVGKIWALIIQLVSVPVFIHAWGVDGFGVWIMISTIPTYLALSDFGLGVAAGVDITSAMERDDRARARNAFQSVWLFLTSVTAAVGVLCVLAAFVWLQLSSGSDGPFTRQELFLSIILAVGASLLTMQMSVRKIIFQATHKYALGTAAFDLIYFIGFIAMLIGVTMGLGIVEAFALQFVMRAIGLALFARLQHAYEPWCRIGWAHADIATIKRLMKPSLSALALTVANSFGLQGVVLTIGWVFGPAAAAIFATTRMLTRIPMQFSGLLTRASLPELTRAQVAGNTKLTRRLMKVNMMLTMSVMLPAAAVLSWLGPRVLHQISNGEMNQTHINFIMLGIAASFCAFWTTQGTRLIAVNRQGEYSYAALGLYFACALVPFAVGKAMLPVLFALVVADGLIAVKTWAAK